MRSEERKLLWNLAFSAGFIAFVQDEEYPTCPDCDVTMDVVFLQLEEDDELFKFMWGDCGCAHVTLCPQCRRPSLGWACM